MNKVLDTKDSANRSEICCSVDGSSSLALAKLALKQLISILAPKPRLFRSSTKVSRDPSQDIDIMRRSNKNTKIFSHNGGHFWSQMDSLLVHDRSSRLTTTRLSTIYVVACSTLLEIIGLEAGCVLPSKQGLLEVTVILMQLHDHQTCDVLKTHPYWTPSIQEHTTRREIGERCVVLC